jgi:hypothetical protein
MHGWGHTTSRVGPAKTSNVNPRQHPACPVLSPEALCQRRELPFGGEGRSVGINLDNQFDARPSSSRCRLPKQTARQVPRPPAPSGGRIRFRHRNKPAWATTAVGQTEKNSVRANVFRVTPESGHCSIQSALRICAIPGQLDGGRGGLPSLGPFDCAAIFAVRHHAVLCA